MQAKTADALALRFAAEAALHRAGDAPRLEGDYYNALSDVYDTGGAPTTVSSSSTSFATPGATSRTRPSGRPPSSSTSSPTSWKT